MRTNAKLIHQQWPWRFDASPAGSIEGVNGRLDTQIKEVVFVVKMNHMTLSAYTSDIDHLCTLCRTRKRKRGHRSNGSPWRVCEQCLEKIHTTVNRFNQRKSVAHERV
jgi:hypothetical protein